MEKFILYIKQGKGIGALFLLAAAVLITMMLTISLRNSYSEGKPEIMLVANEFLPLTVKDGQVVQPVDTYKKVDIDLGQQGKPEDLFSVVLDTRADAKAPAMNELGIFITKDVVYLSSPNQIKRIQFQDGEFTKENFPEIVDNAVGAVSAIVVLVLLIFFFVTYLVKTGFVVLFMSLILKILKKKELISTSSLMRLSAVTVAGVEFLVFALDLILDSATLGIVRFGIAFVLVLVFVFKFLLNENK